MANYIILLRCVQQWNQFIDIYMWECMGEHVKHMCKCDEWADRPTMTLWIYNVSYSYIFESSNSSNSGIIGIYIKWRGTGIYWNVLAVLHCHWLSCHRIQCRASDLLIDNIFEWARKISWRIIAVRWMRGGTVVSNMLNMPLCIREKLSVEFWKCKWTNGVYYLIESSHHFDRSPRELINRCELSVWHADWITGSMG